MSSWTLSRIWLYCIQRFTIFIAQICFMFLHIQMMTRLLFVPKMISQQVYCSPSTQLYTQLHIIFL